MIVDAGNSMESLITTTIDPKALPAKNLRRGGRAAFNVSTYLITLYNNLANAVPTAQKTAKVLSKSLDTKIRIFLLQAQESFGIMSI